MEIVSIEQEDSFLNAIYEFEWLPDEFWLIQSCKMLFAGWFSPLDLVPIPIIHLNLSKLHYIK